MSTRNLKEDHLKASSVKKMSIVIINNTINRMLPRSSLPSHVLSYVGTFAKTKYS